VSAPSPTITTDVLVIGAGPVGLWAVFELGLQGLHCEVVDTLDQAGGQCMALYADKPIYDIPGRPVVSGQALTQDLLQQIKPFQAGLHFRQQVTALTAAAEGCWQVQCRHLAGGPDPVFAARAVVIAAGVGAFLPKTPKLDGLAELSGRHVFFDAPDASQLAERHVCVLGGEHEAVQAALTLADQATTKTITLLHRRDVLQAPQEALERLSALRAQGRIRFVTGQVQQLHTTPSLPAALQSLHIDTPDDGMLELPCDVLLIAQGLSPKLGPLSQWGLDMARKQLCVDSASFATSAPGIYAVGDIVDYPGKRKLIVSGFHEATQAAFAIAAQLDPEHSSVLQYTTSSTLLHQRLGVYSSTANPTSEG
jgi:thioredoxin reductase (NADPH)